MPATPDRSSAADEPGAWEAQLADAFAILLGRPLDGFDPKATYVLYHWDDMLSAELFDFVEDAVQLGSTLPPLGEGEGEDEYPLSWGRWSLDLGRSVFLIDGADEFDESTEAALRAASLDPGSPEVAVTGADLAPHLADHDGLPPGAFLTLLARVDTPGTLFDALRAATWTMGARTELVTDYAGVVVEPEWEQALADIADPDLRRHLSLLCLSAQSARSEGAYYSGVDRCPADLRWLAERPDHTFVSGWEFGEGQASSAIFGCAPSGA